MSGIKASRVSSQLSCNERVQRKTTAPSESRGGQAACAVSWIQFGARFWPTAEALAIKTAMT